MSGLRCTDEDSYFRSQTRQGNVSEFRRLHLEIFTGEESHLDAEQWLIDKKNLLVATRVLEADRVDVVKI